MDAPARVVHPLLVAALVLVAICGYLAGSHRVSTSAAPEDFGGRARAVSSSGLLLEYPIEWERARAAASIPGLAVRRPVTLVPHGTAGAGLLSGLLPAGEPGPLPAAFLARLHGKPHAEVVDLVSTQAYRYSHLEPVGYRGALDLYVIPDGSEAPRVMACYAPHPLTPASQQCERIVAAATPIGATSSTLTPEPTYSSRLSSIVSGLDQERLRARTNMSRSDSASALAAPAASLASRLSAVSKGVSALEAPQIAGPAQAALARALGQAADAYSALAVAAREESLAAYEAARGRVGSAETAIDASLENFALLGYGAA